MPGQGGTAALGHDVRVVMPAFGPVEAALQAGKLGIRPHPDNACGARWRTVLFPAGVLEATIPGSNVPIYFVAEKQRFGDRPFFYGYKDDPYRFAFFSRAALDLTIAALEWRPDIVHAHDWHTAPAGTWLATAGQKDPRYAGVTYPPCLRFTI